MMAYRSSVHDSINTSPTKMTFGRELRLPIDILLGEPENDTERKVYGAQYANDLRDKLNEVHEFARSRMKVASDAMERRYDIKANLKVFESRRRCLGI